MATVNPNTHPQPVEAIETGQPTEIRLYSHSNLLYWWPVWLTGFVLAFMTWMEGTHVPIPGTDIEVWMHPSKNLGVFFGVVLFLVILSTNFTVRGMGSAVVILFFLLITVLFAYLGWWEQILRWVPHLAGYLNLGFYLFFSTILFVTWVVSVFIYDRMNYWVIRAGQITHMRLIGVGERSYDTHGIEFDKTQNDFFRHVMLGLGSGDIHITVTGARPAEFDVPNVLFVNHRLRAMQELIASKPDVVSVPQP